MTPPKFYTGRRRDGSTLWASVDIEMHHVDSATGETRFSAYLKPFPSPEAARAALEAAGCDAIEPEAPRRDRRRNGRR